MKKVTQKTAFTLIELLVSMSIIVMLTVLFIANYRDSNKRTDLVMAAQVLVTDIRYAQSNTLGLIIYGQRFPEGGWGLHVSTSANENTKYYIFADEGGDGLYGDGEADEKAGGKIVFLPRNIQIKEINVVAGNSSSTDVLDVTFLPPDPTTLIDAAGVKASEARIVLENVSSGDEKTIYLNFLGLIEVED